jgi:hypothetical protein
MFFASQNWKQDLLGQALAALTYINTGLLQQGYLPSRSGTCFFYESP